MKKGERCTECARGPIGKEKFSTCPFCSALCASLACFPAAPSSMSSDPILQAFHFLLPSSTRLNSTRLRLALLVGANPPNFAPFEIERIAGEPRKKLPIEYATLCSLVSSSGCDYVRVGSFGRTARVTRFHATRGFSGNSETATNRTEIMERTRIKHRAKIDFMLRKQLDLKVHADYKAKKSRGKTRARKRKENAVRYF